MCDYNPVSISIKAENFIKIQNKKNYKETVIKAYQYLIGKLIYLSCIDILFIIG